MSTLAAVWSQVESLLNAGISVIPVRDKESVYQGRIFKPKIPFKDWKIYQSEIITKEQLWHDLEKFNTNAIAMVCGTVSGNLEAIDIDVKYQAGIDAQLFAAIKEFYPDIGAKLRVHRSPSGGYHFLYRVSDATIPGNCQLALRAPTDAELAESPKRKKIAFIETRGEGGYIMCPPSLGYQLIRNPEIPTLTWAERSSLINLCKTFNLYFKPEPPPYLPKSADSYYSTDPWTDYSMRSDPVTIMESFGWSRVQKQTGGDKIYFTRPGGTKGDTHGTFSRSKLTFYVYSSNTGLDPNRAYNLGTLLAFYQFNGDKKRTFAHLVSNGFGVLNPRVEKQIVKQRALRPGPMPANISAEAMADLEEATKQAQEQFPFGVFWMRDDDEVKISREGVYACASGFGFRLYRDALIQVQGQFLHIRTPRFAYDAIKSYIQDESPSEYEAICNAYESFLQRSGTFTLTRLPEVTDDEILHDTRDTCYKFFSNGYVTVQQTGYTFSPYTPQLGKFIWHKDVQQRDWRSKPIQESLYIQYLKLATRYDTNPLYLQQIIGYLAHGFKDETTGFIIILTEESADPKAGGGSGKNIFCSLFRLTTTVKNIPASQVTYDEKFLQYWNGERILTISDAQKDLDLPFFKELSTGSGLQKKLYKDQQEVPCQFMPKFVIQTNHSFEVSDGGLRRRLIPVEFTDHFTNAGGVDVHFGCYFPDGWQPDDWAGFDHFIIECVIAWLRAGLKLKPQALSPTGWRKQFEQEFGLLTTQFIEENWEGWCKKVHVKPAEFNTQYLTFCVDNNIQAKYRATSVKMNNALHAYAKHNEAEYIPHFVIRDALSTIKVKKFLEKAPF